MMTNETITEVQPFSSVWWNHFLETTNSMTQTSVFKDCLSKEDTNQMREYILEILADIAQLRTTNFGYRVYIEGQLLESNDMIDIYDSPPVKGDTIESWVKRTFGDKKFGMIINQGERFNLELSKQIAIKLKPLLDKIGMPTEGFIFTLFVGNYDSTPLGIHLDLPGKSVIHFHLGPGGKKMYTWDTKEYESLVGEKKYNNQEVSKYLPYAQEYPFEEGDLYFMPEDTYHIGTQSGLSVAIACWCNNKAAYDFATRLQGMVAEKYLEKTQENLKADKNPVEDTSGVNKTLDLFNLPDEYEELSFKEMMKEIYKDLRYSLYSNGGYRKSPIATKNETDLKPESTIQSEYPFKILYKESLNKDKLHVFVRGTKLELNNFGCIKSLIDEINKGEPMQVANLLSLLDEEWDESVGIHILSLFYKYNGIVII